MARFGKVDEAVISLLLIAPAHGVSTEHIMSVVGKNRHWIRNSLAKLQTLGLAKKTRLLDFDYFVIPESSQKLIRNAVCPRCKTVKKIYDVHQELTHCANKDCQTRTGKRTLFWIKPLSETYGGEKETAHCA